MQNLKRHFMLDPEVIYLNHGSFGACPRPVFEIYQEWQRQLETQPVEFLGRKFAAVLGAARKSLADFLGVNSEEVVFFSNPTTAINMVARNLALLVEGYAGKPFRPGDHVLSTNHEYGALDRTWKYNCDRIGVSYINHPLALPLDQPDTLVEHFFRGVNESTRVIFISHITSPTGLILPVQEIVHRAREAGILTIVDGAHAPGQIDLDLESVGADIYTGTCHKWLMAPKGSAFLYARPEVQEFLNPLVISWGYQAEPGYGSGNRFIDWHEWQGTRDISAFLSIPAAIEFQAEYGWKQVRQECWQLAIAARSRINQLTGYDPVCGEDAFRQMFTVQLPDEVDIDMLAKRLYADHRIEVPCIRWNGLYLMRISIQGYNSEEDIDCLIRALRKLL